MNKKNVFIVIALLSCLIVGTVLFFILNKRTVRNNGPTAATQNEGYVRDIQNSQLENRESISKKLNPYRLTHSSTPLKDTVIWQRLHSDILNSQRHKNYRQAKVITVVTPLLEYEVEFLGTKIHKIMDISEDTMMMVPSYEFDNQMNITNASYTSIPDRAALSALDSGALILFYVKDPQVLQESNTLEHFEPYWFAFAD